MIYEAQTMLGNAHIIYQDFPAAAAATYIYFAQLNYLHLIIIIIIVVLVFLFIFIYFSTFINFFFVWMQLKNVI